MRWEDERWVPFPRPRAGRWAPLSLDARLLYPLLLRVADTTGHIELDAVDGASSLASSLAAPWSEIEPALQDLERRKWIAIGAGRVQLVGFVDRTDTVAGEYVRLYNRDTPEWLMLSWRARGLLCVLFLSVDRAGLLKLARTGLPSLAAVVGAPWEKIAGAVDELVFAGPIRIVEDELVIPNFLDAQETKVIDTARKRAERERARDARKKQVREAHQTSLFGTRQRAAETRDADVHEPGADQGPTSTGEKGEAFATPPAPPAEMSRESPPSSRDDRARHSGSLTDLPNRSDPPPLPPDGGERGETPFDGQSPAERRRAPRKPLDQVLPPLDEADISPVAKKLLDVLRARGAPLATVATARFAEKLASWWIDSGSGYGRWREEELVERVTRAADGVVMRDGDDPITSLPGYFNAKLSERAPPVSGPRRVPWLREVQRDPTGHFNPEREIAESDAALDRWAAGGQ